MSVITDEMQALIDAAHRREIELLDRTRAEIDRAYKHGYEQGREESPAGVALFAGILVGAAGGALITAGVMMVAL